MIIWIVFLIVFKYENFFFCFCLNDFFGKGMVVEMLYDFFGSIILRISLFIIMLLNGLLKLMLRY